ncbi:BREX-6 system phosphatase PglZ [Haliangium ochraceum]|uniref:PglZ domain protein n=1 Tax=Haliangium ochraceum (strain DSM 14365 / JCM 11303 / SMP-2) TaxID=502025 RepID=D0LTA3_HALO1|nr:BREX-6 system phosphatase PglZ [Haliangium ochraceum]ACY13798.1 PglZ domain protein [Haliangium ochraceum DSM 14365]
MSADARAPGARAPGVRDSDDASRAQRLGLGPVSAALERDLRQFVRRHGLSVWLDPAGHYTELVDHLAQLPSAPEPGHLDYEVRAFRGSYLALMHELANLTSGVHPPRLLVHLPGLNDRSIRTTPLYELYKAGKCYSKSLDTAVSEAAAQRVAPGDLAALCARADLSLAAADAWLSERVSGGVGGGLRATLENISASALIGDLLRGEGVATRLRDPGDAAALWAHLEAALGLRADWARSTGAGEAADADADPGAQVGAQADTVRAEDVAFAMASWAQAVEYVGDLRRPPVSPLLAGVSALPAAVRTACGELAEHLRQAHADFYRRTADETEDRLADEVAAARAEDLGRIDTFRFEEDKILEAAIAALRAREFDRASEYVQVRAGLRSPWVALDAGRRAAWQLVAAATALGQAIADAGAKLAANDHDAALAAYCERGAKVDSRHRELEQARFKLLGPQVPRFDAVRACLDDLRAAWRAWADAWAEDFTALCERDGFLPRAELQQRHLFDDVVRAHAQAGTTALFLVDALRYEMATALRAAVVNIDGTAATSVRLDARFAELPTVTEVGMNALAPVSERGRLTPKIANGTFQGFSAGEFQVKDPETRRRAMGARVGGSTCPLLSLSEVLARDARSLKHSVAQARLVVVHSLEIDQAGEHGTGLAAFEDALHALRNAWQLLRDAGIKRFVFTADHGFLLLDSGAGSGGAPAAQAHGRKIDPKRRHVISSVAADHSGETRAPLSALGYDGSELHAMFPRTCAPFDTGARARDFVHGGNSLQERVIPVLSVVHRSDAGGTTLRYRVEVTDRDKPLGDLGGVHRLRAGVRVAGQSALDFGAAGEIELALRAREPADVSAELVSVSGGARIEGGRLLAKVGEDFELHFRLSGNTEARALVELHHPGRSAELEPGGPARRFSVTPAVKQRQADAEPTSAAAASEAARAPAASWLAQLPAGVREVFAHIEAHGVCVENEAIALLGGARKLRRFSAEFEKHAALAPFGVRIDTVGGIKRYVKEGTRT